MFVVMKANENPGSRFPQGQVRSGQVRVRAGRFGEVSANPGSRGLPWGFRLGVSVGLPVPGWGGGPRTAPDLAAPSLTEYSRLSWDCRGAPGLFLYFFFIFLGFWFRELEFPIL